MGVFTGTASTFSAGQTAGVSANLNNLVNGLNAHGVILDEIHHAGDEQAWGASLRAAFDRAARRLALSGTPFRSDTRAIPFVRYVGDEAEPDFEYGYGDALRDGRVVRPVYFPRLNPSDGSARPRPLSKPSQEAPALPASTSRLRTWRPTCVRAWAAEATTSRLLRHGCF